MALPQVQFSRTSPVQAPDLRSSMAALSSVGDQINNYQKRQDLLAQQTLDNQRKDALLGIQQAQEGRARDLFNRETGEARAKQVGEEQTNLALSDPLAYRQQMATTNKNQDAYNAKLDALLATDEDAFLAYGNNPGDMQDNTQLLNKMSKVDMAKLNSGVTSQQETYANEVAGKILATPVDQREALMKKYAKDDKFKPTAQQAQIFDKLLEQPVPKDITGSISMRHPETGANMGSVPLSQREFYKAQGWVEGILPTDKDGNSVKKDGKNALFGDDPANVQAVREAVSSMWTSDRGIIGDGDVAATDNVVRGLNVIQLATGTNAKKVLADMPSMLSAGGILGAGRDELDPKKINSKYEGVTVSIEGEAIPVADAITAYNIKDALGNYKYTINYGDKGKPSFAINPAYKDVSNSNTTKESNVTAPAKIVNPYVSEETFGAAVNNKLPNEKASTTQTTVLANQQKAFNDLKDDVKYMSVDKISLLPEKDLEQLAIQLSDATPSEASARQRVLSALYKIRGNAVR